MISSCLYLPVLLALLSPNTTDQYGDALPPGAIGRLGTVRLRHGGRVQRVEFSADGKILASFGLDRVLRLWDAKTSREIQAITLTDWAMSPIWTLSPSGKYLASSSYLAARPKVKPGWRRLHLWDAETGKELCAVECDSDVEALRFSPDNKTLAAHLSDTTVRLFDAAKLKEQKCFKDKLLFFRAMREFSFSPDGTTLAAGGWTADDSKKLQIWRLQFINLADGEVRDFSLENHELGDNWALAPDHSKVAVQTPEGIQLIDTKTHKQLQTLDDVHGNWLSFSPDSRFLAAWNVNESCRIWDLETGKLASPPGASELRAYAEAFSPDNSTLAVATENAIRLLDRRTGKDLHSFKAHGCPIYKLALSPDGKFTATTGSDDTVRLWDMASSKELHVIEGPPHANYFGVGNTLAFSPDGKELAVAWQYRKVVVYESATGMKLNSFDPRNIVSYAYVIDVQFSPDGKALTIGESDGVVRSWDVKSGKELWHRPDELPESTQTHGRWEFRRAAFAPNGKQMLLLESVANKRNGDGVLTSVELGTLKQRHSFRIKQAAHIAPASFLEDIDTFDNELGSRMEVSAMTVCPDGRHFVLLAKDRIRLFDLLRGREVRQFGADARLSASAVFSPNGKTLAAGASDGTIRLWDVATGTSLGAIHGHRGSVTTLAYSADGKRLISGSEDTTALVWDVERLMKSLDAD